MQKIKCSIIIAGIAISFFKNYEILGMAIYNNI